MAAAILAGPAFAQVEIPAPPAQQTTAETLEDAWKIALRGDQRVEAGQWQVASAQSSWAAARAERLPSLTLGADYYALNQQPELQVTLPGLPMVVQQSFINQNSGGAHGIVTQPLYTFGTDFIRNRGGPIAGVCQLRRSPPYRAGREDERGRILCRRALGHEVLASRPIEGIQPHGPPPRREQFVTSRDSCPKTIFWRRKWPWPMPDRKRSTRPTNWKWPRPPTTVPWDEI